MAFNLGVAGLMGLMWFWERKTSQTREQQLDEAHARIMADHVLLDQLIAVVRSNSDAMTNAAVPARTCGLTTVEPGVMPGGRATRAL